MDRRITFTHCVATGGCNAAWRALLCLVLVCLTSACNGQTIGPKPSIEFEGTVTDARTGAPLEGVFVLVGLRSAKNLSFLPHGGGGGCMAGGAALRTDKNGHYRFSAKLAELKSPPYPSYWGADVRLYKPGWRVHPPMKFVSFLPEEQTSYTMVPEPSFEKRMVDTQRLFELCERGKVDRGWSAWHTAIFDEVFAEYCSNDDFSYATFERDQGRMRNQLFRMRGWRNPHETLTETERSDRGMAIINAMRAAVPTYTWPYGLFFEATDSPRDFTPEEKESVCGFFAAQRTELAGENHE